MTALAGRVDRLSRYLSAIAIREGITARYDRALRLYVHETARLERMRRAALEAPLW